MKHVKQKLDSLLYRNGKLVYDEVTLDHIISGDTDSVYIDLSEVFDLDDNETDIIKYADDLGHTINGMFPRFLKDAFNVPDDRCQIIETEREAVSDKSFFLAKKKYAMHIVDMEGNKPDVGDDLKMMGLEIRKSDTPKITQAFLLDLIHFMMNGADYDAISAYVDKFYEDYVELSFHDIGIPMTVKNLNQYAEKYDADRDNVNAMKGFPWHVRAALYYNNMCSMSDVKINSGDRIKITYVDHKDYKYIAIPYDLKRLPDFMDEFDIDWKTMKEKVKNKLEIYLTPVELDHKNRNINLYKSIFSEVV